MSGGSDGTDLAMDGNERDGECDGEDTHVLLWADAQRVAARLTAFVGGRGNVLASCHPGVLMAAMFAPDVNTNTTLQAMIDDTCALANRSVVLGGEAEPQTEGDRDAQPRSQIARRAGDRDKARRQPITCPVRQRVDRLLETLYYTLQSVKTSQVSYRLLRDHVSSTDTITNTTARVHISDNELAAGVERFSRMEVEDASRLQNLLLYLLNTTQSQNLRRNGTDVYRKIYTTEGDDTHAWERIQTIKEFVYESARKEVNFEQWLNLTSNAGNAASAAEHLTLCYDVQFPVLARNRHVFSFSNGVYLAEEDAFVPYAGMSGRIGASVAACKYFDLPFESYDGEEHAGIDWYDIPTPSLQKILDHQDFSREVSRWMYILIGRLMYNLNEHDGWQVIPYLMGQAGSGKSSILVKVCRALYELGDVGVLSNNVERKFGLAAFAEKYLFIAPEIKQDLQLEQAEFQSLVSGEALQLNIKFKTAVTIDWVTPGIMAGNEFPSFKNNSGSIDRRVVIFQFVNGVEKGDMELGKKLEREMPALIKKANAAYRRTVQTCGRDDIWSHLPPYFKEQRASLAEATNPLSDFVSNGNRLRGDMDAYILVADFQTEFMDFCTKSKYVSKKANVMDIKNELKKFFPLVVLSKKTTREWPIGHGRQETGAFIEGVGWALDVQDAYDRDELLDRHAS